MADNEEWSSNANESIHISIIQPGEETLKTLSNFHPRFTYPIFGEEERIFGYQGLKINLRFAAHDLYPNVAVSYDSKFKSVGETKAADIVGTLKDWLPPYAFGKLSSFKTRLQDDASSSSFNPPGKLIQSYTSRNRQFEIWCVELTDPAVRLLLERMQIFVSFFIEAGTPLELDDQDWTLARWRVFLVYEKIPNPPTPTSSSYSIVGYSTSYRFLTYQATSSPSQKAKQTFTLPPQTPISVASLPFRARISQFLILPPHQGHSHGTHLYNAMFRTFLSDPFCAEVTVEDPSEAFDDLRDYCDYAYLLRVGVLAQISLNANLDPKATARKIGIRVPSSRLLNKSLLETLRRKHKIAPRQFDRLVELHLLLHIPPHIRQAGTVRLTQRGRASDEGDRMYYYWRLLVKQRIYKKNKDTLMQLDRLERIDKVEEALGSQQGDYERLLRGLARGGEGEEGEEEEGEGEEGEEEVANGDGGAGRRQRGKRKIVEDEDEDEDDDTEDGERTREAKRRKEDTS